MLSLLCLLDCLATVRRSLSYAQVPEREPTNCSPFSKLTQDTLLQITGPLPSQGDYLSLSATDRFPRKLLLTPTFLAAVRGQKDDHLATTSELTVTELLECSNALISNALWIRLTPHGLLYLLHFLSRPTLGETLNRLALRIAPAILELPPVALRNFSWCSQLRHLELAASLLGDNSAAALVRNFIDLKTTLALR